MRLLITGKTRSGKSTALHKIISHCLREPWVQVILFDGKGSELHSYQEIEGVRYYGAEDVEEFAAALEEMSNTLPTRYAKLTERGLRKAAPGDPRYLLIADEIQRATRHPDHKSEVRDALNLIAEQSAALGDVLILSTQRLQWSIPVNTRYNFNSELSMLGCGYFHLKRDGAATEAGRVAYIDPDTSLSTIQAEAPAEFPLDPDHLLDILGTQSIEKTRAPATLYIGERGSGRTHALKAHKNCCARSIYLDLAHPHKDILVTLIEQANAAVPAKATIPEMAEIAALALQAEPTLLLLDNYDRASKGLRRSTGTLMDAAAQIAIAATSPQTSAQEDNLAPLVPRCCIVDLKPLNHREARTLAEKHLPSGLDVEDREAALRRITRMANGHPATIVALARRVKNASLREMREWQSTTRPKIALGWLALLPLLAILMLLRGDDAYWISLIAMMGYILMRPMLYRAMR